MIKLITYVKVIMNDNTIKYGCFSAEMQDDYNFNNIENERLRVKNKLVTEYGVKISNISIISKKEYEDVFNRIL